MLDLFSPRSAVHMTRAGIVLLALVASGCGGSNNSEAPKIGGFEVDDSATSPSKSAPVATSPAQPLPKQAASTPRPNGVTVGSVPANGTSATPTTQPPTASDKSIASIPAKPANASKPNTASSGSGTTPREAVVTPPGKSRQPRPRGSRVRPPQSVSGEQLSAQDIPENSPKKLQAFIERVDLELARITDPRMSPDAVRAKVMPLLSSKLTAAEKILGLPSEEPIREVALKAKLDVLTQLQFLTAEDLTPKFREFGQQLRKEQNAKFARQGRFVLLQLQIQQVREKKETNVAAFVDEIKAIVAEEDADISVFEAVHGCAMALECIGRHELAQDVLFTGATKFAQSEDPRMAIEGNIMLDHLGLTKAKFFNLVEMVVAGRQGSMEELTGSIQTLFSTREPSRYILRNLAGAAAQFEIAERYQECRDLFEIMSKFYTDHSDPEVAEEGTNLANNGKKRLNLLGKPFTVEGVQVDGKPFDWTTYRNKVVLVEFWATTNAGCVEEIPKIKQAYELYKDKGFTVVGVNLDEDTQRLNRFLVRNQIPWETVISPDPKTRGYNSPMAVRCGVDQLPFLVLVDQQGVAIALNTADFSLREKLRDLLGPVGPETPGNAIPKSQRRPRGPRGAR